MTTGFNRITYAGHAAVFLESSGLTVAIDPWLRGNPICPPSLQNPSRLDLIVLTHGHSDHASDVPRLAKATGAMVAATFELANILIKEGVPGAQLVHMNKGGTAEIKGLRITLTHALHSSTYDTESGPVYAGEACGAVIDDGKTRFYHAGDTCLFSDIALIKEFNRPDIAFLPIGDRFTMGPKEAARAAQLVGCKIAVPIHYKTFDALTGTAEEFRKECAKFWIEVNAPEPGDSFTV